MRIEVYAHDYERDYKNRIGPGPAAYSKMYDGIHTDEYKKNAFSKQKRKLTQPSAGPGPSQYESHWAKDKQALQV